MSNFTPAEPLNGFYCVLLSLGLLSTEIGLIGIISSSLLIYKVKEDSKLLVDGSDICGLKGKPNGKRTVECGNSCGLLTCPGFSLDKLDKEGTQAELCDIVKECTRGRYSAGGLALTFSLVQTVFTVFYICLVFIEWDSMYDTDLETRWCAFIVCHGFYLCVTIIPMTLALVFNQAHVPDLNPSSSSKLTQNWNLKGKSCDRNAVGILFVSWSIINFTFCFVSILLILYFQRVRKNPQDILALACGEKDGIGNVTLFSGTTTRKTAVDDESRMPQKSRESRESSEDPNPSRDFQDKKSSVDFNGFSKIGGILGGNSDKSAVRDSGSVEIESSRSKRKTRRISPGGA